MLAFIGNFRYHINRTDYQRISWEYSRQVNQHTDWQEAKINGNFVNIKVDNGVVVQLESATGINYIRIGK
jgi:hypothetical protein